MRRLEVKPGLTGWAPIHGRASLPWPERLALDVHYVDNQSLALDSRILARTAGVLLRRDIVYRGEAGGWR
jgi:lipopolysaccharide/colanic/teichoic acid biosynthesis glycosyltransferase